MFVDDCLESLLLLSAVVGCCPGDCYLLAAQLAEGVVLLLNLDFLRLLLLQMAFLDHLLRVRRQTIHIRHLLLDHELLLIALVEYGMEEVGYIPFSVDLDRAGLGLPLVTGGPMMLVWAVSLTHEVVSIFDFDLEIEY